MVSHTAGSLSFHASPAEPPAGQRLNATRKQRHDFKHTIRMLKNLADNEDLEKIRQYRKKYLEEMPESEVVTFCQNAAVNAVLNSYLQMAGMEAIDCRFQIDLPEDETIPDTALCSILGNALENAIYVCRETAPDKRYIYTTITPKGGYYLFIAVTNSFMGRLRKQNDRYLSTRKNGSGIGLHSIVSVSEHLGALPAFPILVISVGMGSANL